jgi:hypothetical protein
LVPGHTKFGPDSRFGNAKTLYKKSNIESFYDVINVIKESSLSNEV